MSDESPTTAITNDGIAGVYAYEDFAPGGSSSVNLVLATDGTFSYEETDQGEGYPVREPDDSSGWEHPAPQITTESGSWTYDEQSGRVELTIPKGPSSGPFMSLTLSGGSLVEGDAPPPDVDEPVEYRVFERKGSAPDSAGSAS
jgi:hypothetical protein